MKILKTIIERISIIHYKKISKIIKSLQITSVVDVGSHLGEFIEPLLKNKKIKIIYMFEPQNDAFKFLKKKFSNINNLKLFNIALYKKKGSKKIYINKFSSSSTLKRYNKNSKYLKLKNYLLNTNKDYINNYLVKTNTIDDQFKKNNIQISLLKLDVEGSEYDVLLGAKKTIKKIDFVIIEKQFFNLYKKNSFKFSHRYLDKNGFQIIKKITFPTFHYQDIIYKNKKLGI
jgi:FkbM family methyltransferase